MPSLETIATRAFIFVIVLAFVYSSPIVPKEDSALQRRLLENFQTSKRTVNPAIRGRLLRALFNNKSDLLSYLSNQIKEEKRQRQCYWSVISCY